MNFTFLIGNGFDLNIGLKTQYSDFLKEYLKDRCSDSCDRECTDLCERYWMQELKKDMEQNMHFWSAAELELGKSTEKFKGESAAENFCDCHGDFCENLAKYLKKEQQKIDENLITHQLKASFHGKLLKCHANLGEVERIQIVESVKQIGEPIIYNFINFNYTDTLRKVLKVDNASIGQSSIRPASSATIGQMIHVHGTVEKDMVLGVNDESQLKNIAIFEDALPEYKEQLIKKETNLTNNENIDEKANAILNSSSFIYVYGMSIGETDAIWWERLCILMSKKEKLQVVIFAYDAPKNDVTNFRFKRFKKNLINKILSFSRLEDELKESVRKRIHIDRDNLFEELKNIVKEVEDIIILEGTIMQ